MPTSSLVGSTGQADIRTGVTTATFTVIDMQCAGCEGIIESAVKELLGVNFVKADYATGNVNVIFDASQTRLKAIYKTITAKGYTVKAALTTPKDHRWLKAIVSGAIVAGIVGVMIYSRHLWQEINIPEIDSKAGNGMIVMVGLISGLHCIGMCGSFVIGYSAKDLAQGRPSYISYALYGIGKTMSYALFGGLFGFVGSLFKITPFMSGISTLVAGTFLIVFGLNMLNFLPSLRQFRIRQPEAMSRFAMEKRRQSRSPFFIGFFSGFLIGCGPLQAMYVMAAGNGNVLEGAKMLVLFGIGTLPALVGFGLLTRLLSAKMMHRFQYTSGIILIIMGSMMLNNGLLRTESGYDTHTILHKISPDYFPDDPSLDAAHTQAGHHSCH